MYLLDILYIYSIHMYSMGSVSFCETESIQFYCFVQQQQQQHQYYCSSNCELTLQLQRHKSPTRLNNSNNTVSIHSDRTFEQSLLLIFYSYLTVDDECTVTRIYRLILSEIVCNNTQTYMNWSMHKYTRIEQQCLLLFNVLLVLFYC